MITAETKTEQIENIKKRLVNKTIKKVEISLNCLSLEFEDGTELLLEAEHVNTKFGQLLAITGYVRK